MHDHRLPLPSPARQIASDLNFENPYPDWLYGDHYKWRAMRTNGVDEDYITGTNPMQRNL
jgi:glucuronate isomerase